MNHKNYLLIISFMIIILTVPILGMVRPDYEFSTVENRNLESLPVLDENGIEAYTSKIENYLVDQFPSRDRLLDVYTKLQLLSKKIRIRNTIVLEDWLFVRDYKVNEANLNDLVDSITETVNKNPKIDFNYVIVANKTAMLADLYPKYIDVDTSRNNNELISNKLKDIQGLKIANVFDKTLESYSPKERENHYYQTDFHWNSRGAFKAFQVSITQTMGPDVLKAAEKRLKKVEYKNKYFKGDLERRFSENIKNTDKIDSYQVIDTKDLSYYTSINDNEPVDRKEIVAKNIDKDELTYNDIFTYNLSCIRIVNKNPILDKKVLIFKDSYFNAMIDPMTTIFSELIIIDPRFYKEDYTFNQIIKEKNPDYVFFFYHQSNIDNDLVSFLKD